MKPSQMVVGVLLLSGCAHEPPPVTPIPISMPPSNLRVAPELTDKPVVQTSRYTLANPASGAALVDILNVPVEVRIPKVGPMNIGDGLNFLLNGSGMALRTPTSYGEAQRYRQPLPLAHTNMGTMPLREALQVIGGEAFELEEDVVKREVGLRLKAGYHWDAPTPTQAVTVSQFDSVQRPASLGALGAASSGESLIDTLYGQSARKDTKGKSSTKPSKAKKPKTVFKLAKGERYREAVMRWARQDGYKQVALAQDPAFLQALDALSPQSWTVTGSLAQSVARLSAEVSELRTLSVDQRPSLKLAGFHPWSNQRTTTTVVEGTSLKDATHRLVKDYGWQWDDAHSWQADDLPFTGAYPIVTPKYDITQALAVVLAQYPLKAQKLDATQTIYIREANQ
ncbi:hypothetical protein GCM10007938_40150 [Vibrio zhanjiangensis]|uniref:Uncharacterized protein n=1 Tax=Vibrio zhanjiangensis TaxID=1046128 RepID=A0ABQ6F697_9VIBR|nr:hypothetical protein [Vibrio zhanjiangensis]GLT20232.1 hypothetical protein GCM10007938_40150 [Vibrio zhanjiangensis]